MNDENTFVLVDNDELWDDVVVIDMDGSSNADFVTLDDNIDETDFITLSDDAIASDVDIIDVFSGVEDIDVFITL